MEGVNFIDLEGADALKKIARAGANVNIDLHLARVKPQVLAVMKLEGAFDVIGSDHIHDDITVAVAAHLMKHPADLPHALDPQAVDNLRAAIGSLGE